MEPTILRNQTEAAKTRMKESESTMALLTARFVELLKAAHPEYVDLDLAAMSLSTQSSKLASISKVLQTAGCVLMKKKTVMWRRVVF